MIPGRPGINSVGVTGKPLGVRQPVYVMFLDGRGEPLPPGASRLSGRTRRAEISLVGWTPNGESRLCPQGKERGDSERQDREPISHNVSPSHGCDVWREWNRLISSLSKGV